VGRINILKRITSEKKGHHIKKQMEGEVSILLVITVIIGTVLMTSLLVCYIWYALMCLYHFKNNYIIYTFFIFSSVFSVSSVAIVMVTLIGRTVNVQVNAPSIEWIAQIWENLLIYLVNQQKLKGSEIQQRNVNISIFHKLFMYRVTKEEVLLV
jgi:hypothetical protein